MELSHEYLSLPFLAASEPTMLQTLGDKLWVGVSVAVGVGLVIFIHELGHFLAAKLFGVKVEKFYVGFDVPIRIFGIQLPRHFGRFRWGETEYGIGVIPLGGYVKMLGQDDDPRRAAAERERIRLQHQEQEEAGAAIDGELDGDDGASSELALDPRSYPAKSVWQRMVIISAGVVMNLITSVFFGAAAFMWGVNYTPAVVGSTVAGYPAWRAGVAEGGRVISAGRVENDPKLHFKDMQLEIIRTHIETPDNPVSLVLAYPDQERNFELTPQTIRGEGSLPMIGIGKPFSTQLAKFPVFSPHMVASKAFGGAELGSGRITAINGEAIAEDPVVGVPLGESIRSQFAATPDQPVTLTIETAGSGGESKSQTFTLPPQPYKSLGIKFGVGPVAALVADGPAARAGLQLGDQIVGIEGVDSPLDVESLPELIAGLSGPVTLQVQRGADADAETLTIAVDHTAAPLTRNPVERSSGQVELESLGVTVMPSTVVVGFYDGETEFSQSGELQLGDRIEKVTVEWPEDQRPADLQQFYERLYGTISPIERLEEGWRISDDFPLTALWDDLQHMPVGTRFSVTVERAESDSIVKLGGNLLETNRYWYDRGFELELVQLKHFADSTGEAFALGYREAERKVGEVFSFLGLLATGKLSPRNLGGPAMIATVAGSEASAGFARLLLFLTFLSVNLAILNFLPIPALDGGHMVFLLAEAVRGKPVDEELQARLTMAGVLALLCLMCFVIVNDVINLTGRG